MKKLFLHFRSFLGRVPRGQAASGRAIGFSLATSFFAPPSFCVSAKSIAAIPHAGLLLMCLPAVAQITPADTTAVQQLDEVIVSSIRASAKSAVSFTNVSSEEIKARNLGQDIPALLNYLPSVVTTSDAGAGIGYSSMRVRGSDATRINVTLNGIPYNDSESHGTFWVNLPDFASSTQNLQLQRGVGTSTNGSGAFGASLNLLTDGISKTAYAELSNSVGSFNTRKHTVKFSSGLLNERLEVAGRLSVIQSDGYIDRAASDLKSYFLQGTYNLNATQIKALVFGGTEKTYQAWNGLEDPEQLANDRTFNPAGMYTDDQGNLRFYENQTDNYQQDHYQLHWVQRWSDALTSNVALHWTKGEGYYENYRTDRDAVSYGLTPAQVDGQLVSSTDLVDQKWLRNDFFGTVYNVTYSRAGWEMVLGGGLHRYQGDHFGKVIWSRSLPMPAPDLLYYQDDARKDDVNTYFKTTYTIGNRWRLFGDVQYRFVHYKANSEEAGLVNDRFRFFNPKAGLTFLWNSHAHVYASFGRAHREPNRVDYENGSPRAERLDDYELGWRYEKGATRLSVNAYYMSYHDQLVLTGALNDVGNPIRTNSGQSYRLGIEVDALVPLVKNVFWQPNVSVSENRNRDFYFELDGELTNFGDTQIAFSPNVVAMNGLVYANSGLNVGLFTKFVGEQYMGNIDSPTSKLADYTTTDLSASYTWTDWWLFKEVMCTALINNIFDYQYESNGYFYTYDDNWSSPGAIQTIQGAGFYPQAGIHFMLGLNLKF